MPHRRTNSSSTSQIKLQAMLSRRCINRCTSRHGNLTFVFNHRFQSSVVLDIMGKSWDNEQNQAPQFLVTKKSGFLPRQSPLQELPAGFGDLESLLQRMPVKTADGGAGLLSTGEFGEAIEQGLKDHSEEVRKISDSLLLTALFRDYTFAASAYLLEPCDLEWRRTEGKSYGLGRQALPEQLARPLTLIAEKLHAKPFMEYAMSYALNNYALVDPSKSLQYKNLRLVRTFDGSEAEHGFILVHVAMVAHSNTLATSTMQALDAVRAGDRDAFDSSLARLHAANRAINEAMETMWKRSSAAGYNTFRTFIMGTYNQPMFPDGGVVYEGVSDELQAYRGESGANDSMVPTMDNFLQITEGLPENPLTEVLRDFREYRPLHHQEWLSFVEHEAHALGVRAFAEQSAESALLLLLNMDTVREFRLRHWNFTKCYIIKYSDHPVATGGSPIAVWLPNQLSAVLSQMADVGGRVDASQLSSESKIVFEEIADRVEKQQSDLLIEVAELKMKFSQ